MSLALCFPPPPMLLRHLTKSLPFQTFQRSFPRAKLCSPFLLQNGLTSRLQSSSPRLGLFGCQNDQFPCSRLTRRGVLFPAPIWLTGCFLFLLGSPPPSVLLPPPPNLTFLLRQFVSCMYKEHQDVSTDSKQRGLWAVPAGGQDWGQKRCRSLEKGRASEDASELHGRLLLFICPYLSQVVVMSVDTRRCVPSHS